MSVVYCVGNCGIKRRNFREPRKGCVSVDNDDVLAAFALSGKTYYLLGGLPFADLTVGEYVSYSRALATPHPLNLKEMKYLLRSVGLNLDPCRRVGGLSRVQFRYLQVAAKVEIDTETIFINFDGLDYSKKNKKELYGMLGNLSKKYSVFVAVSDGRFIPPCSAVNEYTESGPRVIAGYGRRSEITPKRPMLRALSRRGIKGFDGNLKKVVRV